jgi:hypothetical protein
MLYQAYKLHLYPTDLVSCRQNLPGCAQGLFLDLQQQERLLETTQFEMYVDDLGVWLRVSLLLLLLS